MSRYERLDIYRCEDEKRADYEGDVDVRCVPSIWDVRRVYNGEGKKDQSTHDEACSKPIHLRLLRSIAFLGCVRRDGEVGDDGRERTHDCADPKVPSPFRVFGC